jgi:hypothetical protein
VAVEAKPIDPRDIGIEFEVDAYRVYFWARLPGGGYRSREFELTGGDVREALEWADANCGRGEKYTLYVRTGLSLALLVGEDPTRG